jgi:colanic acid/amylovoran biosynthesis glycosyltransferase
MEAMAKGVPVVSTRHGGIPELIQDRRTGYLVPERNAEALAEAVVEIVRNPRESAAITCEARRRVERDFNCRSQNRHLIEVYSELTSANKEKRKRRIGP